MNTVLNAVVWTVDTSHRWLGDRFEQAAEFLEDTAETLRWLTALTRVAP